MAQDKSTYQADNFISWAAHTVRFSTESFFLFFFSSLFSFFASLFFPCPLIHTHVVTIPFPELWLSVTEPSLRDSLWSWRHAMHAWFRHSIIKHLTSVQHPDRNDRYSYRQCRGCVDIHNYREPCRLHVILCLLGIILPFFLNSNYYCKFNRKLLWRY